MQFRLRTPLIVLAVGPAVLYGGFQLAEPYAYFPYCDCAGSDDIRLLVQQMEAEGYVPPHKPFTGPQKVVPKPSSSGKP